LTKLANRTHSREGTRNELGRPTPTGGVGGLRLEELRVRQHDSELVIEAVIQPLQPFVVR